MNGSVAGKTTWGELFTTTAAGRIGNSIPSWAGAARFNGLIDEPAIWSKALGSAEVFDLYNSGTGVFISTNKNFNSTGSSMGTNLQGLWHFDDILNPTADSSTNSNTGSLLNMAGSSWVSGTVGDFGFISGTVQPLIGDHRAAGSVVISGGDF